jgi:hypothetical protein
MDKGYLQTISKWAKKTKAVPKDAPKESEASSPA